MSYTINKTDGTLLVNLIDGTIDNSTTDLSLIGKNYTGFGEAFNENFIKLLENFSNTNQPVAPLVGQTWYDKSENKLKVFDGDSFQSAAGAFISESQPNGTIPGDTWFSTVNKQFYLFTGTEWQLIGPAYSESQGESGFIVDTIDDQNLNKITILKLIIDESLQAVISSVRIIPNQLPTNVIQGLVTETNPTGTIFKGWNFIDPDNFIYRGVAEKSQNLISATGRVIPEFNLVKKDENTALSGVIEIINDAGVTIGEDGDAVLLVENGVTLRSARRDADFNLIVNSSAFTTDQASAIKVNSKLKRIGLFQSNPQYSLDVTGDTRITGDLIVQGDTISAQIENISVEDHNITLGSTASPSNTTADGGGITLRGTTDKLITWYNDSQSWSSSENFNINSGKEYRIANTSVLTASTLGSGVTNSSLTNVGVLTELRVDGLRIDGTSILNRNSQTGLVIGVSGGINVSLNTISNLSEPEVGASGELQATPRIYVDREIQNEPIVFSYDLTGYNTGEFNDRLIELLDDLYPSTAFAVGKEARVACYYYGTQQTDPIDIAGANDFSISTVEVEPVGGVGSPVTVMQGINLPNTLTPEFNLQITRLTRRYIINSLGSWVDNN